MSSFAKTIRTGSLSALVLWLGVAAVCLAETAAGVRDSVFNGVTSVYFQGSGRSKLLVTGNNACWVMNQNMAGGPSEYPFVAATLSGPRILAVAENQILNFKWVVDKRASDFPYEGDAQNDVFNRNMIAWASGISGKSVKIVTYSQSAADWLISDGYGSVTVATEATLIASLANADVFLGQLGDTEPAANISELQAFLGRGKGWITYDYVNAADATTAPVNQVFNGVGVDLFYAKGGVRNAFYELYGDGSAVLKVASYKSAIDFVGWDAAFEVWRGNRSGYSSAQQGMAMGMAIALWEGLATAEQKAKLDAGLVERLPNVTPTSNSGVGDTADLYLLEIESTQNRSLTVDQIASIGPHRTALKDPYLRIPDWAPRVTRDVIINPKRQGWQPTGLYAPPGEIVTIKVPPNLLSYGWNVQVNHLTHDRYGYTWASRMMSLSRSFPLNDTTVRIANPYGGMIHIMPGRTDSKLYSFKLTISNAVESPTFILGKTSEKDWEEKERVKPAPWAEVYTDTFAMLGLSDAIRDLDRMEERVGSWSEWNQIQHQMANWGIVSSNQRCVTDWMMKSAGYSGNPFYGTVDWFWSIRADPDEAKGWGHLHEVGHNHGVGWWNLYNDGEVICNYFAQVCTLDQQSSGGYALLSDFRGMRTQVLSVYGQADKKHRDIGDHQVLKNYLIEQFKPSALRNLKILEDKEASNIKYAGTINQTHDAYALLWSKVTGYNMGKLFRDYWKLDICPEAMAAMDALGYPEWMPIVPVVATQNYEIYYKGTAPSAFSPLPTVETLDDSQYVASFSPAKAGGTVALSDDKKTITYTAPAGFNGFDVFTVTLKNKQGIAVTQRVVMRPSPNLPATGQGVYCEYWENIGGTSVSNLTSNSRYPAKPDSSTILSAFQTPTNRGDNYGARLRASLVVPTTGAYTFYIASDDASSLRFNEDGLPLSTEVAKVSSYSGVTNFTGSAEQKSATFNLTAGQVCYIEALLKEGGGGDGLAVAWTRPGVTTPEIIAGQYLRPCNYSFTENTYTGNEGQPLTIDLVPVIGAGSTVTSSADPVFGSMAINGLTVTYTPNTNFSSQDWRYAFSKDRILLQVTRESGQSESVILNLFIKQIHPKGKASYVTVNENKSVTINPLDYVTSPTGAPLMTMYTVRPSAGSAVLNADGTITYTPDPDYNGPDCFGYAVRDEFFPDGKYGSVINLVNVTVNAVPSAPTAADDFVNADFSVIKNVSFSTDDLLKNDINPDGTAVPTYVGCTQPALGTLTRSSTGIFTYTPGPDFNGNDSFTYTIANPENPGLSSTAKVTITVLSSGLQGWWRLDEGSGSRAMDISGCNRHGTLYGDPAWNDNGSIAGSLTFDGKDDKVAIGPVQDILGKTASLCFWLKTTAKGSSSDLYVGSIPAVIGYDARWWESEIKWGALDSSGRMCLLLGNYGKGGTDSVRSKAVNDGEWHHIGFTRDQASGEMKVYVDGELSSSAIGHTSAVGYELSSFGRVLSNDGSGSWFDGELDDIRLYNRVLNEADVQALYLYTTTNVPPVGVNDVKGLVKNTSGVWDVIANDLDENNAKLTITTVSTPAHGKAVIGADRRTITYTPDTDYAGVDSFTYTLKDPAGYTSTATVQVTIVDLDLNNNAWWRLDEGAGDRAYDSSGNDWTATLAGTPAWQASGKLGRALSFDGIDDKISTGELSGLLGKTASMCFWIRTTMAGQSPSSATAPALAGYDSRWWENNLKWGVIQSNGGIGIYGDTIGSVFSAKPANDGAWHHVAMTRDLATGQMQVFLDGELSASAKGQTSLQWYSFAAIGRVDSNDGAGCWFKGDLDDIRLYDRVLSAEEVTALYNFIPAAMPTTPSVSMTAPADGTTVHGLARVSLSAKVAAYNHTVSKVEFYDGSTKLAECTAKPYAYVWPHIPSGSHLLTAKVYFDTDGTVVSKPITVNATAPETLLSAYGAWVVNHGAVAYWRLDESAGTVAEDYFGTSPGTLVNNPSWQPGSGAVSGSLLLPQAANNDYVNCGTALNLASKSFTVSAWAKRPVTGSYNMLISQGTTSSNKGMFIGFRSNDKFSFGFWNNDMDTVASYPDADWNYWVCTYDTTTKARKIYRNGVEVASGTSASDFLGTGNFYIGRSPNADYFKGGIDEVAVYDRVLTGAEILEHYRLAVPEKPAVLLTSPLNGTEYPAPATIALAATVTPYGHTVSKVEFYNGATKVGEAATQPYAYSWSGVLPGSYSLTAKVIYDGASSVDSAAVGVTVLNTPPVITTQPKSLQIYAGLTARFSVAAYGNGGNLAYQWQSSADGVNWTSLAGTTTSSYSVPNVLAGGNYRVIVSDSNGATTSAVATLGVKTAPAAGTHADTVLRCKPIAYWELNETGGSIAYDYAGGNNGTLVNAPVWQPTGGQVAGALALDNASKQYVNGGSGLALANKSFSIGAWIKRSALGRQELAVAQGPGGTNLGLHFGFRSSNKFTFSFWGNDMDTASAYTDANWNFWVGTYDSLTRTRKIYCNGVEVATGSASANYQGTGDLLLGQGFSDNFLKGSLDEVAIYDTVLSATDILRQYQAGLGGASLPSVTLTAPLAGTNVPVGATVSLAATVAPNGHTITKVEFYNGATKLGEDFTAPYTFDWLAVPYGGYSLTAIVVHDGGTVTSAPVQISVGNVSSDLLLWWKLDEAAGTVATDSAGYANNGTIAGATWNARGTGGALSFAGSGMVDIASPTLPALASQISIAFWCYGSSSITQNSVLDGRTSGSSRVLNIHLPWSDNSIYWDAGSATSTDRISWPASAANIKGQWNHWVFTKNATTGDMKIYLNGVLRASGTGKTQAIPSLASLRVGAAADGSLGYKGLVDDVRVYRRALSDADVTDLYNDVIATQPPEISLANPVDGLKVAAPANLAVTASVVAHGHSINKVEFLKDDIKLGEASSAPYAYSWNAVPVGAYAVKARVVYDTDLTVDSAVSTLKVLVAPTAQNGTLAATEDSPSSGTLVATAGGSPLTYVVAVQPAHGAVAVTDAATGAYTYTPDRDFNGTDSFSFEAYTADLMYSNAATVTVTVAPVNDAPVATSSAIELDEDTIYTGRLGIADVDGDTLKATVVAQPAHGTVSITDAGTGAYTYTPATHWDGSDSFTFKANDGKLDSNIATVTVTVRHANHVPVADAASVSLYKNSTLPITLTGSDADVGDVLAFSLITPPAHGTLSGTIPALTYTPATDYKGSDSFTFKVSDGKAYSAAATIDITVKPRVVFLTSPTSVMVAAGKPASFTVSVTGEPATPMSLKWQSSVDGGISWGDLAGATNATYSIPSTAIADNGKMFQCIASNGQDTVVSSSALLTVNEKPVIVVQPASVSVNAGLKAEFSVEATGWPALSYQWQISRDGGATWKDILSASAYVYSMKAEIADNGAKLRCVVSNSLGSVTSAAALLTVNYEPSILEHPANRTVLPGMTATFSVKVDGVPAPTYQWQWSLNGFVWTDLAGSTASSYTTPILAAGDDKRYRCVVSNPLGSLTSAAALLTIGSMPAITKQPSNATSTVGDNATFSVSASGTPMPGFAWYSSTDGGWNWTLVEGAILSTYVTPLLTAEDNGKKFRCIATNLVGSAESNVVTLTVQSVPSFTMHPADVAVKADQPAVFSVEVAGVPAPTYQWQISSDGIYWVDIAAATSPSAITATYTRLISAMSDNGKKFRCVASNSLGTVSSNAATMAVTMPDPPVAPSGLSAVSPAWNQATVAWQDNSDNEGGFKVERKIGPDGVYTVVATALPNATSYLDTTLSEKTQYFYRIRAFNSAGDAVSAEEAVVMTRGSLRLWWPFDEGTGTMAADASGNGFDGAIDSGGWSTTGTSSNCLSIGASATVNIPPEVFTGLDKQLTVAAWTYGDTTMPSSTVLFYANDASGNKVLNVHLPWYTWWTTTSTMYWDAGNSGSSSFDRINKDATTAQVKGQWNHWAFVKDLNSGTLKIYLNGALWHSGTGMTKTFGSIADAKIGGNGYGYRGKIDDFRIYDRVLSDAEILALATMPAPVITVQPEDQMTSTGDTATFSIVASGLPTGYQWQSSPDAVTWADIAGATSASYKTPATVAADNGRKFRCIVSNAAGSTTSNFATLTVVAGMIWTNPAGGSWPVSGNWLNNVVGNGSDALANFSTLDLAANATVTLDGSRTIGHLKFGDTTPSHSWTLTTGSPTTGRLTLDATLATPTITVVNETATLSLVVTSPKGMVKAGSGRLVLGSSNSFPEGVILNAGSIYIGNTGNALGGSSGGATVVNRNTILSSGGASVPTSIIFNGGTLQWDYWSSPTLSGNVEIRADSQFSGQGGGVENVMTLSGKLSGSAALKLVDTYGGLRMRVNNPANTYNGTVNLNSSNLILYVENATALQFATVNMAGGGRLSLKAPTGVTLGGLKGSSGTVYNEDGTMRTLTINNLANFTYTAKLGDGTATGNNFSLVKLGNGTLTLSGSNSYFGSTTVGGGTLVVSSSLPAGSVSVGAGGTLAGTGTIGGATSVDGLAAAKGTLSMVNGSLGSFTFADSLTLGANAVTVMEISRTNGAASDLVKVSKSVGFGGTLKVVSLGGTIKPGDRFVLFSAASYAGAFSSFDLPALSAGYFWDTANLVIDGSITVRSDGPLIEVVPAANPSPVTGTTTDLSVLVTDSGGEEKLTYTWETVGLSPAEVTFSANASNAAKNTTATFTMPGTYTFQVTAMDETGLSVSAMVDVVVARTPALVTVSPATNLLPLCGTRQFSAAVRDQFSMLMAPPPSLTWSCTGVGGVSKTGFYTASILPGTATVKCLCGTAEGTATVTVVNNSAPVVMTPAVAWPSLSAGIPVSLSVLGDDDGGEENLTYTWEVTDPTLAPFVTFAANGTNASKVTKATITKSGTYFFKVTLRDISSLSATSTAEALVGMVIDPAADQTVERLVEGENFAPTAKVLNSVTDAPPTYHWFYTKDSGVNWIEIVGQTAATLDFTIPTDVVVAPEVQLDGGRFKVKAEISATVSERPAIATRTWTVKTVFDNTTVLTLSPSGWAAPKGGGTQVVAVTSNNSWTVTSDQSWLTLSAAAGVNNGSITLTAAANPNAWSRTATVTFQAGSLIRTLTVAQDAATQILTISPTTWGVSSVGGTQKVTVTSNAVWTVGCDQSWVTLSAASGSGNGQITLTVPANPTIVLRKATVTFTAGAVVRTLIVGQTAGPATFTVSPSTWSAPKTLSTQDVTLTGNCPWTASSSQSWLTLSAVSGSNSGTLTLTAAANLTVAKRTATVTLKGNGTLTRTISVSQAAGDPTLAVSPTTWSLNAASATQAVAVTSNTSWTVSSDQSWLVLSMLSGIGNGSVTMTAAANPLFEDRTGTVTFKTGALVATVVVTQKALVRTLEVAPVSWDVLKGGGQKEVIVTTNSPWTVFSSAAWVSPAVSEGVGDAAVMLTATMNPTIVPRSALVTFTAGPLSRKVAVTQEAGDLRLEVSPDSLSVPWDGGSLSVSVANNATWTASSSQQWLTLDQKSGAGDATVALAVAVNPTVKTRTATVTFSTTANGQTLIRTLTVVQVADTKSYMIIDLSGGPNANSYPVSYGVALPDPIPDDYRTTKLVLRKVIAGSFLMGSPATEVGRHGDEIQRQVTLARHCYVGVFEVTQKQWSLVMGNNPSTYKSDLHPVEMVSYADIRGAVLGTQWPASSGVDASSFIGRLRSRAGVDVDLPTEAQWEYACRAGTTSALYSGMNLASSDICPNLAVLGRYNYNRFDGKDSQTNHAAVGKYVPNALGLYDMYGNAFEWCLDWYGYYGTTSVANPKGAVSGTQRLLKGGCWVNYANNCRSAERYCRTPGTRHYGIGFRLAQTVPAVENAMLAATPVAISLPRTMSSDSIQVVGNVNWTATSSQSWLTLDKTSGSGNGVVTVTAAPNLTVSERTAVVSFDSLDKETTVVVTQAAGEATISVTPATWSPDQDGGTQAVAVVSNSPWTVESSQSWLSLSGPSGLGNGTLTLTAGANPTTSQRTALVTFTAGAAAATVAVVQAAGDPLLYVYPGSASFPKTGGSLEVSAFSNTGWTVSSNQSWASLSATSGSGYDVLTVTVANNPTTSSRTAKVTFVAGALTQVVTITQSAQDPTMAVTPATWSPVAEGATQAVTVSSNANWTASSNQTWLTLSAASGSGNGSVTLTAAANATQASRQATVTFTAGSAKATVSVTQPTNAQNYLVIDLAGGPAAATYPVSNLSSLPNPIPDSYRTTKLVLRKVDGATFQMGSPTTELGRQANETQHAVTVSQPYYIGVFEVTQKQWTLVMGANPSNYLGDIRPVEKVSYSDIRGSSLGTYWPASSEVDATSFLGKIRARTGIVFDLPTEAQWELACRAGTTSSLNSGKNLTRTDVCSNLNLLARYNFNRSDAKGGFADAHTVVGQYVPNALGLYDMHGNVSEWCLDWFADSTSEAATDPAGPSVGIKRVVRGGGWLNYAFVCRSGLRLNYDASLRYYAFGFRLAAPVPAPAP